MTATRWSDSTSRIDAVLESARARLSRVSARDVPEALDRGAVLVDIRPPLSAHSRARCPPRW